MEKETRVKINKQMLKKRILPTLIISFLMPLVIILSIPFEIYANNTDQFLFAVSDFLPLLLLFAFIAMAIIFFLIFFTPQKTYSILCSIIIAFSFLFFIQGSFLNGNSTSLAGDNLNSSSPSTFMFIFNALIWIIVIAGAIILALIKDKHGIISAISVVIIAIVAAVQIIVPISNIISNNQVFMTIDERLKASGEENAHKILTNEYLANISTSNNIFYFCIDRFDERYAEQAYNKYPGIYNNLTGFTWFQDHISIYSQTYPAVATMLTNNELNLEKYREDYLNQAYANNNTLSVLSENGYDINLHTQNYYAFTDAASLPNYVQNAETVASFKVANPPALAWNMIKLACFRVSPLALKFIYTNISSNNCNKFVEETGENGNQKFSLDMKEVYDFVNNTTFKTTSNKQFNFIHLEGCHDVVYDENWNNISSSLNKDVAVTVKSSFMIIDKYIEVMKELGVYDTSTIIITGDHGFLISNIQKLREPVLTALFVKEANSTNEDMKISQAQTSHDNLWATIMDSENISTSNDYGTSVFDIPENINQKRRLILHTYCRNLDEYTYEINGSGKDFNNWKIVHHTYHQGRFIMD